MIDGCQVVDDIQQQMVGGRFASADSIVGCTEDEIQALEKKYDIRLPSIYRAFLGRMGHRAGDFLVGTNWTHRDLSDLRSAGEELIGEAATAYRLPADAFVFAMHQGYSFLFFASKAMTPRCGYMLNTTKSRR